MYNHHDPSPGHIPSSPIDLVPAGCPFSSPHQPLLCHPIPVHLTDGFVLLLFAAVVLTETDTVCLSTVPKFIE